MEDSKGLRVRKVQLVIDQIDSLPTLPSVAAKVLSLASSSDASARDLTGIIESDQALTSRILALVNSASFGYPKAVTTINRAVALLGFEAIRNCVLSVKVFDLFSRRGLEAFSTTFDRKGFWKHSLAVAAAARMIAQQTRRANPEEAFVAGLLHDLGKVGIDYALPKTFDQVVRRVQAQRVTFIEAENRILGLNHCVIGKRLAENWHFSATVANVIWLHHQAITQLPADLEGRAMVEVVCLADLLAREQRIGVTSPLFGAEAVLAAAEALGLKVEQVEAIGKGLHKAVAEHAQIMGLEDKDEQDLLYESLSAANGELGSINERLMAMTRRLQRQRLHTAALAQIAALAHGSRRLQDLLAGAAQAFLGWLEVGTCAIYVVGAEGAYVEGVVKSSDRPAAKRFLFEMTADELQSAAGPVDGLQPLGLGRAERSQSWLFDRLGDLLGTGPFYSQTIRAEGRHIGSIIFCWPDSRHELQESDVQELDALALTAGVAIVAWRQREQSIHLTESLAEANRLAGEAQSELLQRRSLAAVGAMASGAAHEINNPLAVISGRAQILIETEQNPESRKALEIIWSQAERASGIISELMSFARPVNPDRKPTDLVTVISRAVEARRQQLAEKGVTLASEPPSGSVPSQLVDAKQMQWALEELVVNALAAVPSGGRITLRADYDAESGQTTVNITDTGSGMDHETLQHAFDPFFCGRRAGRGKGLGLPKVRRIVEANGAAILIESANGQGTIVRLVFSPQSPDGGSI